ncbi:MAG: hypothetical protein L0323_05505 [Planctomycetes bacterium]|nr:hypothetical protein [Planctomycetota bacterium]
MVAAVDDGGAARVRAQANARLEAGDPEGALEILEGFGSASTEDGETALLLGLATERAAESGRTPRSALLFGDASSHFENAARLLPADPRPLLGLSRSALREGETERALEWAARATSLAADGGVRREAARLRALASLERIRGEAGSEGPPPSEALAREATEAVAAYAAIPPAGEDSFSLQAEVHRILGRSEQERGSLLRGIEAHPDSTLLHSRLIEAHRTPEERSALLRRYESLAAKRPEAAVIAWYLGRATESAGDAARGGERWEEAEGLYSKATAAYERSARLEPGFRETSEERSRLVLLSRGWCAFGLGRYAEAGDRFAEAIGRRPDRRHAPDAFGRSAKDGVDLAALRLMEKSELVAGEALLARACAAAPELDWWTNLGYFRWELGQRREADGDAPGAKATFEAALAAHEKARELAPEDPAALNDCVLILYYHLKREDDRSEKYLRSAIAFGEKALKGNGLDAKKRRVWEEATGNAYQNLGILHYEKKQDLAGARQFLQKSLEYYPYSRARVRWLLARIDRENRPVAAPASGPVR